MDVFIAWSGEKSNAVAIALSEWIPDVLQDVRTWLSEHIDAGARWIDKLNKQLESADCGVLCLIPDNLLAPWILYEAGALGKAVEKSAVVPYCCGLKPTDIKGPLSQFQAVVSNRKGTLKLIKGINELASSPLSSEKLERHFSKWWPDLASTLQKIQSSTNSAVQAETVERNEKDILEEILSLVRELGRSQFNVPQETAPGLLTATAEQFIKLGIYDFSLEKDIMRFMENNPAALPVSKADLARYLERSFIEIQTTVDRLYNYGNLKREHHGTRNEYVYSPHTE